MKSFSGDRRARPPGSTSRRSSTWQELVEAKAVPKTFLEIKSCLERLVHTLPEDPKKIDEQLVDKVYSDLAASHYSDRAKKKRWGFFLRLVQYLSSRKIIRDPGTSSQARCRNSSAAPRKSSFQRSRWSGWQSLPFGSPEVLGNAQAQLWDDQRRHSGTSKR